ncbi:MAG TPA: hypothetical protein VJ978_12075, partial [Nitriliruptoraceae bacterium]|nr:hypothetical protein [Nitriliruptoraceae bacterium]
HLRDQDGSYWTGHVFTDGVRWPVEQSSWTAAAVILAADAIGEVTPGSAIFATGSAPFPEIGLECGCRSDDRLTGVSAHPGQRTHRPRDGNL